GMPGQPDGARPWRQPGRVTGLAGLLAEVVAELPFLGERANRVGQPRIVLRAFQDAPSLPRAQLADRDVRPHAGRREAAQQALLVARELRRLERRHPAVGQRPRGFQQQRGIRLEANARAGACGTRTLLAVERERARCERREAFTAARAEEALRE